VLHHLALGQQHKAFLGFGQFDHNQINAVSSGRLGRFITAIALVNEGKLHRSFRHLLNLLSQLCDLGLHLFVGWRDQ